MLDKNINLTTKAVARRLNVSTRTLERLRAKNKGPRWFKVGARVRYRLEEIERYEQNSVSFE